MAILLNLVKLEMSGGRRGIMQSDCCRASKRGKTQIARIKSDSAANETEWEAALVARAQWTKLRTMRTSLAWPTTSR